MWRGERREGSGWSQQTHFRPIDIGMATSVAPRTPFRPGSPGKPRARDGTV